jgi:hypothetical protein
MSKKNDADIFDNFVNSQIEAINEYFEWEIELSNYLEKKICKDNRQFKLVDRNWLEKWKEIVGYEKIKKKCQEYINNKNNSLFKEIYDFLLISNAKQKLDNLGIMDESKLLNKEKKNYKFNETSDFLPINSLNCYYLKNCGKVFVRGDFIKGKLILYNSYKNEEEKKLVIFEKSSNDNEFYKTTIGFKEVLKKVKEQLKSKTTEELINDKNINIKIIKKDIIKNNEIKENNNKENKLKNNEAKEMEIKKNEGKEKAKNEENDNGIKENNNAKSTDKTKETKIIKKEENEEKEIEKQLEKEKGAEKKKKKEVEEKKKKEDEEKKKKEEEEKKKNKELEKEKNKKG